MFNKYKKKILLILTLVFLFNFSFSYKRAEASVLVAGGIGLGVVLLAAAGVAITSPQMAEDLGGRLWDGLKEIGEVPKKVGDFFKVQVTGAMLEFTSKWINKEGNIPTEPQEVIYSSSNFPNKITYQGSERLFKIKLNTPVKDLKKISIKFDGVIKEHTVHSANVKNGAKSLEFISGKYPSYFELSLRVHHLEPTPLAATYVDYQVHSSKYGSTLNLEDILINGVSIREGGIVTEEKITIPYTPEVKAGATEEKLTTSLPVGSTVTYPSDLTTNFPATADKPISTVTDIPNVKVDTNATDIPGTDTGVIEGTLTNIAELLQSLVNAITNIFVPPSEDLVNIDLSPLYVGITDKFPFSVPFDLIKTFQNMSDSSKAPRFEVKFPEKYFGSYTFVIDFEQFNDFVLILRYFLLLSFIVFLILQTRNIIGG